MATSSVSSSTTTPATTTVSAPTATAVSNASTTPTGTVSVASSGTSGAAGGSVINVSSLVSQLVTAQVAPQQAQITSQTQAVTTQISALGTLQGALSTFQSSLSSLDTPSVFNTPVASTSQKDSFTAIADSSAASGTYNVSVTSLASAQQLVSGTLSATASIGDGTLTLSVGGKSFNVTIGSANDTLSGIASAINNATGNSGIQASVIQGTDGSHLLLASAQTGAANTITVSESDGGTALSALTYGSGNTSNYTQAAAAKDASFSVAGVPQTSASNTITNALGGVTLTLLAPTTGTGGTVTVSNDTSTAAQNISSFVDAYNTLQSTMASLGSYDSTSGQAGALLGNEALNGTKRQIQSILNSFVGSSTYNSLASIGVTTNKDGSLSLNSAKLQGALQTNYSDVSNLFSGTKGIATQLNTQINNVLSNNGTVGSYATTLQSQNDALTDQSNKLQTQMQALTTTLTQQYSALNALLSSLQTTSSQLSQAFASLPTVQGTPNA